MRPYQEEYLALLRSVTEGAGPRVDEMDQEEFVAAVRAANRAAEQAVERGTRLLRENLFPLLDDILDASPAEVESLVEFAGQLMSGREQKDVGLNYRIHLALVSYARHKNLRDMLIRELYLMGMSLFNLENMLSPNTMRLYSTRMRMCFAESASYFETEYDQIEDAETRGYIHRSMGNIALSYDGRDAASAEAKLAAIDRSIRILTDPDIRARTPSLPWDLYAYKSHQERTTLLSYLRSGMAGADAFAQVLESAQTVQERQLKAARERGDPIQPQWQYTYLAARYHCGAILLTELLDGLYALSTARPDDEFGTQSMFSHVAAPAYYMHYSRQLTDRRLLDRAALRVGRMTRRMCAWIVRVPGGGAGEQMMFNLRQFLHAYREFPGNMPFFEVLQNVFAARQPASYVRMWVAGQIARQLCDWAVDDCPEELVGLPGCGRTEDVIWRRKELLDFAERAGRLYDTGMVHFFNLESLACRGLFEEEEALLHLHAYFGADMLRQHPSTEIFADVAHGHHLYYDGRGGFPVDFSLSESPVRAMIFLVAAADTLASAAEEAASRYRPVRPFEEAAAQVLEGSGTRYAPFVSALLRPPERRETLRGAMAGWNRDAYLDLYRRREQARLGAGDGGGQ